MDRDMVNCVHYIYQWGKITKVQLNDGKLFWCTPDTQGPLTSSKILCLESQSDSLTLSPGVCELVDEVENQLRTMPRPDYAFGYPISAAIRLEGKPRPAFLAISYKPTFEQVKETVQRAAMRANFKCEVTGDLAAPGAITDQVWQGIRGSDAVVADITGNNPNVFYEVGLAHALGKEIILLSQEADAPFDIRSLRRIRYNPTDMRSLEEQLVSAFGAVSPRYPFEGLEPRF